MSRGMEEDLKKTMDISSANWNIQLIKDRYYGKYKI